MARYHSMYFAIFVRPFMFVLIVRSVREVIRRIVEVVWDSKAVLILMISYVVFFGWVGFRLFRGTQEGAAQCASITDCTWSMLIELTTANYPNV